MDALRSRFGIPMWQGSNRLQTQHIVLCQSETRVNMRLEDRVHVSIDLACCSRCLEHVDIEALHLAAMP